MLVYSNLNSSIVSSAHLLVVHFNDERVLIPVDPYAKYSDLVAFIAREWALDGQQFFIETDELSICSGKRTRIHEEAWCGVKDILGNVHVRIRRPETKEQAKTHHRARESLSIKSMQDTAVAHRYRLGMALIASVKDEMKHEEILTSRAPSESADEAEVEQQTRTDIQHGDVDDETPTARRPDQNPKLEGSGTHTPVQSPKKPKGDTLNLFGDEADNNDEEPEKEEQNSEAPPQTAQKPTWRSYLLSRHKSTTSDNSASTTSTLVTPTPATRSTDNKGKGGSTQPSGDGQASDSERVLIVVEPPSDNIYEARGFRIRREHSVRTVLKGACKAFKIDHTKARLRKVTEVDDGGELVTVKCDDTDTVNSLNVEDNQRFVIELVDDVDEEASN